MNFYTETIRNCLGDSSDDEVRQFRMVLNHYVALVHSILGVKPEVPNLT